MIKCHVITIGWLLKDTCDLNLWLILIYYEYTWKISQNKKYWNAERFVVSPEQSMDQPQRLRPHEITILAQRTRYDYPCDQSFLIE